MFINSQAISLAILRVESEIVIPMIKNGEVIGVLDIDSPIKNRFDEEDQKHLERFVDNLMKHL